MSPKRGCRPFAAEADPDYPQGGKWVFTCGSCDRFVHMFESSVGGEVVAAHACVASLAAGIGPEMGGAVADELLAELLEIGRQVDSRSAGPSSG